jgi:hypothetical protein
LNQSHFSATRLSTAAFAASIAVLIVAICARFQRLACLSSNRDQQIEEWTQTFFRPTCCCGRSEKVEENGEPFIEREVVVVHFRVIHRQQAVFCECSAIKWVTSKIALFCRFAAGGWRVVDITASESRSWQPLKTGDRLAVNDLRAGRAQLLHLRVNALPSVETRA